ncbi:hypothetical protein SeMB42_g07757, partial [Synchytrium endobioticum]
MRVRCRPWVTTAVDSQTDECQPVVRCLVLVGMLIDTKTVSTVLAFSGGQTRDGAGPRTEAFSYYARPLLFSPVKVPPELSSCRVQTCSAQLPRKNLQEITSENLLFSICRFSWSTILLPLVLLLPLRPVLMEPG